MVVRKLALDDLEQLAALYEQFWGERSDLNKMRQRFLRLRHKHTHIFLCAIEEGRLVGATTGIVCYGLYGDCKPFLVVEDMIVDKDNRRRGVGHALMYDLELRARELDCVQILLVTETERADACAFYEAVGFHPDANKGFKKKLQS